jgi:hypothetical protein
LVQYPILPQLYLVFYLMSCISLSTYCLSYMVIALSPLVYGNCSVLSHPRSLVCSLLCAL